MIRADSIAFQVSNDALMDFKKEKYLNTKTYDSEMNLLTDKTYLNEPHLGLKSISINRKKHSTDIELSGKILKQDYQLFLYSEQTKNRDRSN